MSPSENPLPYSAVVGLGNPGPAYAETRHNVGFMVVDEVARRLQASPWTSQGKCLTAAARVDERRVWLGKPTTYMNLSGAAVENLVNDLEIELSQLIVVVDDVDLPLGRLRLRPSGGPGTHNGLRDIVARIGPEFGRLRLGVGNAKQGQDLAQFVLSPFVEEDRDAADSMLDLAVEAVMLVLSEGLKPAMDRFNRTKATGGTQADG